MSETKEVTIQDIINKRKEHSRKVDTKLIMKAYNLATEKHKDQKRSSGEPYIIHPLNVAYILADTGLDESTICAALLHDIVEDTDVTDADLREMFGNEIADMVAGVTKLSTIQFGSVEEQQAEEFKNKLLSSNIPDNLINNTLPNTWLQNSNLIFKLLSNGTPKSYK